MILIFLTKIMIPPATRAAFQSSYAAANRAMTQSDLEAAILLFYARQIVEARKEREAAGEFDVRLRVQTYD